RLQQFSVVGSPRVELAVDDQGQELTMAMEPMPDPAALPGGINGGVYYPPYARGLVRQVPLRIKLGERQAKSINEVNGTLTVQALSITPAAQTTVEDVLNSKGKTATGQNGGSIEMVGIEKQGDGLYKVQLRYQQPPGFFPANVPVGAPGGGPVVLPPARGGAVQIQPAGGGAVQVQPVQVQPVQGGVAKPGSSKVSPAAAQGMPVLVDANGKVFTLEQLQRTGRSANGQVTWELTMVFRAGNGVGEPSQMVLLGHRMVTAQVPFHFEHVPLP